MDKNKSLLEKEFDTEACIANYEEESSMVDDFYYGDTSELQAELDKIEMEFSQNIDSDSSVLDTESLGSARNEERTPSQAKIYKQMMESQREVDRNYNLNNPELNTYPDFRLSSTTIMFMFIKRKASITSLMMFIKGKIYHT